MFAEHPEIAKRWVNELGAGGSQKFSPAKTSESHEVNRLGVAKLPRPSGAKRDFSHLKPSQAARHLPRGPKPNEKESMQEAPVSYVSGSRHSELGKPIHHVGVKGRDQVTAERAIPLSRSGKY
jgi:hypothetical protein